MQDVLVGEVWICSGQSNMQWDLRQSDDGDLDALTAKLPRLRLISVPQVGTQDLKDDFQGSVGRLHAGDGGDIFRDRVLFWTAAARDARCAGRA